MPGITPTSLFPLGQSAAPVIIDTRTAGDSKSIAAAETAFPDWVIHGQGNSWGPGNMYTWPSKGDATGSVWTDMENYVLFGYAHAWLLPKNGFSAGSDLLPVVSPPTRGGYISPCSEAWFKHKVRVLSASLSETSGIAQYIWTTDHWQTWQKSTKPPTVPINGLQLLLSKGGDYQHSKRTAYLVFSV